MKQLLIRSALLTGAAVLTSTAWAQETLSITAAEPGGFYFKTISEGSIEPKPVAGAPYSADNTTTSTQTLADGNRIVHTSTAKIYRDDQGRTRIERTLGNIGPIGAASPHTMITIGDPVAGVHYALRPESHTAEKIASDTLTLKKITADKLAAEKAATGGAGRTMVMTSVDGNNVGFSYRTSSVHMPLSDTVKPVKEDLGVQTIEGLRATGKRTTITIPAGAEGNDRPMQIVDETWYSPELQTNVKTIHSDPRMGETVFTMTNVNRANPDAALFQVPADYQVTEGMEKVFFRSGGAPPPPPPPPPPSNE